MHFYKWNTILETFLISRINAIWLLNMLMLESRMKGQIERLAFSSGFSAAFKKNHLYIARSNVL